MNLFRGVLIATLFAPAPAQSPTETGGQSNRPPVIRFKAPDRVMLAAPCVEGERSDPLCRWESPVVNISADASDPDGDVLRYTFSAAGAKLGSDGPNATLDLTGVAPGVFTVTVEVDDGRGGTVTESAGINITRCNCPARAFIPLPCPTVDVSCPAVGRGKDVTFTAKVVGGGPYVTPTFEWEVSSGAIAGGQGTSSITVVNSSAPRGNSLTATVEVGGYDRSCSTSASCSTAPWDPSVTRKVDEYGVITLGDEKARLNNVYEELRNDPSAQMYLMCYGRRRGHADEAVRRCYRAREYLVTTRGIEASRVMTVDGGFREKPATEFWLVPAGAEPPKPAPADEPGADSP